MVYKDSYHKYGGYNKNYKVAEIEQRELIFDKEVADLIDQHVKEYDKCKCPKVLINLGRIIKQALKNTKDMSCERTNKCDLTKKLRKV